MTRSKLGSRCFCRRYEVKEIAYSVLFILFIWAGFTIDIWFGWFVLIMAVLVVFNYIRRTRNGN